MSKEPSDLRERTKQFALRIIRLYAALPKSTAAQVLGKQVLRSGTSVGAHYREAQRAKSDADFINKIEGGLQELEETLCNYSAYQLPSCPKAFIGHPHGVGNWIPAKIARE